MTTLASKAGLPLKPVAIAKIKSGAPTMPRPTVSKRAQKSRVATALIRVLDWVGSSLLETSPKIGTNAWENAPSANSLRSKLGSRKATLKASVHSEAPKLRAIRVSRNSPVMRDSMVKELTLAAAESRFMGQFSPIYQATGLFNCFQVKSWVLVS